MPRLGMPEQIGGRQPVTPAIAMGRRTPGYARRHAPSTKARAIRMHLPPDIGAGIARITQMIAEAKTELAQVEFSSERTIAVSHGSIRKLHHEQATVEAANAARPVHCRGPKRFVTIESCGKLALSQTNSLTARNLPRVLSPVRTPGDIDLSRPRRQTGTHEPRRSRQPSQQPATARGSDEVGDAVKKHLQGQSIDCWDNLLRSCAVNAATSQEAANKVNKLVDEVISRNVPREALQLPMIMASRVMQGLARGCEARRRVRSMQLLEEGELASTGPIANSVNSTLELLNLKQGSVVLRDAVPGFAVLPALGCSQFTQFDKTLNWDAWWKEIKCKMSPQPDSKLRRAWWPQVVQVTKSISQVNTLLSDIGLSDDASRLADQLLIQLTKLRKDLEWLEASEIGRCELALEDVFGPLQSLPQAHASCVNQIMEHLLAARKMIRVFDDSFDEMARMQTIEKEVQASIQQLVESNSVSHAAAVSVACEQLVLERHKMMVAGSIKDVQQASASLIHCLNGQGFESEPLSELDLYRHSWGQMLLEHEIEARKLEGRQADLELAVKSTIALQLQLRNALTELESQVLYESVPSKTVKLVALVAAALLARFHNSRATNHQSPVSTISRATSHRSPALSPHLSGAWQGELPALEEENEETADENAGIELDEDSSAEADTENELEGHEELAERVEKITTEVAHAMEGQLDAEEVQRVIADTRVAADKLRATKLTEETEKMDAMVGKLEEAIKVQPEEFARHWFFAQDLVEPELLPSTPCTVPDTPATASHLPPAEEADPKLEPEPQVALSESESSDTTQQSNAIQALNAELEEESRLQESATMNNQARWVVDEATHILLQADEPDGANLQANLERVINLVSIQLDDLLKQQQFQAAIAAAQLIAGLDQLLLSRLLSTHLTDARKVAAELVNGIRTMDEAELDKFVSPQVCKAASTLDTLLERMHMSWRGMLVEDYPKGDALRTCDFDQCLLHAEELSSQANLRDRDKRADRHSVREKAFAQPHTVQSRGLRLTMILNKGRASVAILEEGRTGLKPLVKVAGAVGWQLGEAVNGLEAHKDTQVLKSVHETVLQIQRLMASKPTHLSYQAVVLHAHAVHTILHTYDYTKEASWAATLHDLASKICERILVAHHRTVMEFIKEDLTAATAVIVAETEHLVECKRFVQFTSTTGPLERLAQSIYNAFHRIEFYQHMLSAHNAVCSLSEALCIGMSIGLEPQILGFTAKAAQIHETLDPLKETFHQPLICDDVKELIDDSLSRIRNFTKQCEYKMDGNSQRDAELIATQQHLSCVTDLLTSVLEWPVNNKKLNTAEQEANHDTGGFFKPRPGAHLVELWDHLAESVSPLGIPAVLRCKAMGVHSQQQVSRGELSESVIIQLVTELLYTRFTAPKAELNTGSELAAAPGESGSTSTSLRSRSSTDGSLPESPIAEAIEEPQAPTQVNNDILEKSAELQEALLSHLQREQEDSGTKVRSRLQGLLNSMFGQLQEQVQRYQSVDQSVDGFMDDTLRFGSYKEAKSRHFTQLRAKLGLERLPGRRLGEVIKAVPALPNSPRSSKFFHGGRPSIRGLDNHQLQPQQPKGNRRRRQQVRARSHGRRTLRTSFPPNWLAVKTPWDPHIGSNILELDDGRPILHLERYLYDKRKYRKLGLNRGPTSDDCEYDGSESDGSDSTTPSGPFMEVTSTEDCDSDHTYEDDFDDDECSLPSSTESGREGQESKGLTSEC